MRIPTLKLIRLVLLELLRPKEIGNKQTDRQTDKQTNKQTSDTWCQNGGLRLCLTYIIKCYLITNLFHRKDSSHPIACYNRVFSPVTTNLFRRKDSLEPIFFYNRVFSTVTTKNGKWY